MPEPILQRPRALRPGDRLAVVAPASPFDRSAFDAGIGELRALGFEPVFDERVFARHGYVAGEAELRAHVLREAWRDPSIAGIVCVRGGFGSVHLLPYLDPAEIRQARKPFVGYSDLTSLLVFLTGACGQIAFHGPTVAGRLGRGRDSYDRETFLGALCHAAPLGQIPVPARGLDVLMPGDASGVLLGGTLTLLAASLGTPFAFDPPVGHVLFLDEVNERPYRIDRMLTQLRMAGILERAAAIVFGELPGCDEPGGRPSAHEALAECLRDFRGPVVLGLPSGHTTGPALTLPLGVRARVTADAGHAVFIIEEAAVG